MALHISLNMFNYISKTMILAVLAFHLLFGISESDLRIGFYSNSCSNAESIVRKVVQKAVSNDPNHASQLLRLHFHDCYVEGCDGSILLDKGTDGSEGEQAANGNSGLQSFDVIQHAKVELELACPRIVSCADIVALAARDAVFLSHGPFYDVPTGRRDGRVSSLSLAANLPEVDDSIELLKLKFREKGLSLRDLVLLSAGAHTIGSAACFFMPKRLYNFTGKGDSDPTINSQFLPRLKSKCPVNGDVNARLPLDWTSRSKFDDQIFRNIRRGFAALSSDARLYDDRVTKQIIDDYVRFANKLDFKGDFGKAMVKMGRIGVKIGLKGEIRRVCNAVN